MKNQFIISFTILLMATVFGCTQESSNKVADKGVDNCQESPFVEINEEENQLKLDQYNEDIYGHWQFNGLVVEYTSPKKLAKVRITKIFDSEPEVSCFREKSDEHFATSYDTSLDFTVDYMKDFVIDKNGLHSNTDHFGARYKKGKGYEIIHPDFRIAYAIKSRKIKKIVHEENDSAVPQLLMVIEYEPTYKFSIEDEFGKIQEFPEKMIIQILYDRGNAPENIPEFEEPTDEEISGGEIEPEIAINTSPYPVLGKTCDIEEEILPPAAMEMDYYFSKDCKHVWFLPTKTSGIHNIGGIVPGGIVFGEERIYQNQIVVVTSDFFKIRQLESPMNQMNSHLENIEFHLLPFRYLIQGEGQEGERGSLFKSDLFESCQTPIPYTIGMTVGVDSISSASTQCVSSLSLERLRSLKTEGRQSFDVQIRFELETENGGEQTFEKTIQI